MANEVPELTPEYVARIRRLESIFSPQAHRQREDKRLRDNPGTQAEAGNKANFAHYTSADAALQIIGTKRLWMRSTTCMTDYREVDHGHDLLVKYFQNTEKAGPFYAALDAIVPGAAKDAVETFDKLWNQIRLETYIASVSDHDATKEDTFGRLSMWRAFSTGSPRVALVFSVPWLSPATEALGLMFSPVSYLGEQAAHAVLDEVTVNVSQNADFLRSLNPAEVRNWIFVMLVAAVCCSKHEGFWEEREWRGVMSAIYPVPPLLKRSTESIKGVPQWIYKIPFDESVSPQLADLDLSRILQRVIIGPTPYGWVMYQAFVDALRAAGVPNPESRVWTSNLPIRD